MVPINATQVDRERATPPEITFDLSIVLQILALFPFLREAKAEYQIVVNRTALTHFVLSQQSAP